MSFVCNGLNWLQWLRGDNAKIAIKIIDDRGIESPLVISLDGR